MEECKECNIFAQIRFVNCLCKYSADEEEPIYCFGTKETERGMPRNPDWDGHVSGYGTEVALASSSRLLLLS